MTLLAPSQARLFLDPVCILTAHGPLTCSVHVESLLIHESDMPVPTRCGCHEVTGERILGGTWRAGCVLKQFGPVSGENLGNLVGHEATAENLVLPLPSLLEKQARPSESAT